MLLTRCTQDLQVCWGRGGGKWVHLETNRQYILKGAADARCSQGWLWLQLSGQHADPAHLDKRCICQLS